MTGWHVFYLTPAHTKTWLARSSSNTEVWTVPRYRFLGARNVDFKSACEIAAKLHRVGAIKIHITKSILAEVYYDNRYLDRINILNG